MRKQIRINDELLSPSILKAACAWIDLGATVLALYGITSEGRCACNDRNCRSPGKHPIGSEFPKGQHSATSSKAKIVRVLKKNRQANLGVVLPEGIVVLDVDGPQGKETYQKLKLPKTASVRTGRGKHYYFRVSSALPKKRVKLHGIDIKDAQSGYIVVPPSSHHSGKAYQFLRANLRMALLPKRLRLQLSSEPSRTFRFDPVNTIKAGGRNNELTKIAGSLRFRALPEAAIAGALKAINSIACNPPLGEGEVKRIAASVSNYEAGYEEAFGWLGDVEESEPKFLAYPYIVKGALTVLDGNMGQGKSTFTCAVAAAVTTGRPPPFVDDIENGTVLFMSAEDDPSRVLKPRLLKAGADVSKVRYQEEAFTLDERGLSLLRQELSANTPMLVVIDPIIAFMKEGADGNKATETMHFMVQIDLLAREFDTAILIVRHLRKARADHAMHQGIGSISISARVRSGLILAPHPDNPRKRAVAHAKSNYAEVGPTIVFEMESDGPRSHPHVKWHPCEPELSVGELLAPPELERGRPPKERDTATNWLETVLSKEPVKKKVLDDWASDKGISLPTLRRAGDALGVTKSKDGKESVWALP